MDSKSDGFQLALVMESFESTTIRVALEPPCTGEIWGNWDKNVFSLYCKGYT